MSRIHQRLGDQLAGIPEIKILCFVTLVVACLISTECRAQDIDPGYPFNQYKTFATRSSECGSYGDTPTDKGPAWAVCAQFQLSQGFPAPVESNNEIQKFIGVACSRGSDRTMAEYNATSRANDLVIGMQNDEIRTYQANGLKLDRFDSAGVNVHCMSDTGSPPNVTWLAIEAAATPSPDGPTPTMPPTYTRPPAPPQPPPPPTSITFIVHNNDRFQVGISFFSQSRKMAWPGGAKWWTLGSGQSFPYHLSCNPGEQICFGAWRAYRATVWGVGRGDQGCTGCCQVCGNALDQTISDAGPDTGPPPTADTGPPPTESNTQSAGANDSGSIINDLSGVLNGAAAGLSLGGALGGLRNVPEPPALGPGRGPPTSTITGH